MKIAVTGSRGQLACSLRELAARDGISCTALARPSFDLTCETSVQRALDSLDCEVLINAAAYTAVDRAEQEPEVAFAVNAGGAETIARACARRGIPIIHISTDYVFDGNKRQAYVETDLTSPVNVYGRSKCAGEESVTRCCAEHIILRTSWVHSPFGSNFVKTMLRLGTERREIAVVNDQYGSPTYAPHLGEAILAIAASILDDPARGRWGLYHCTDAGRASWFDVATKIFSIAPSCGGPTAQIVAIATADYKTAARRPLNSWLNSSKLADAFGMIAPRWETGVEMGVRRILAAPGPAQISDT